MPPLQVKFRQARHYKPGPRKIDYIVIHTAEIGEFLEGAEALMNACATQERVASWHYAVDPDSITQSVKDFDIAFHAPGANHNGIGIEFSGRARQTPEEWQDDYSFYLLENAARLCAELSNRHNIPLVFVPRETLKLPGARGITTHNEVSKAFGKSDHWDPGPSFPMAWLIQRAIHYRSQNDGEKTP